MMKRTRAGRFALSAAALAALGFSQSGMADTNSVLVQTNVTIAPGAGGGTFNGVSDLPSINATGQVGFVGNLAASLDGATAAFIRVEASGNLTPMMRNSNAAPGVGGGVFSGFQLATINNSGQVMALAALSATSDGSGFGLFRTDGGPIVSLLRDKGAAPGTGGGIINSLNGWTFNDQGMVTALAFMSGTSDGSTSGIFQGDGSPLQSIVRHKQTAPGAGVGQFSILSTPANNNSGQIAFFSNLQATNNGTGSGLFRANPGLSEVFRNGQAAPGGGELQFFAGPVQLNDAGQVAFFSNLLASPDGASRGVFRTDPDNTTVAIARQNQSAPGGGSFATNLGAGDVRQNSRGQVIFTSNIVGAADGSTRGLFRGNGSELTSIARVGAAVPGGGTISAIDFQLAFSNSGAALFTATLSGTPEGSSDNTALYLSDGRDTVQVVRKGQAMSSSIVTGFGFNQSAANGFNAINANGQVAYLVNLADGTFALARFQPSIHFREQFGGSWDNSNNWTLGINPASVHEVLIDPQFGANVTGPAGNVTIASLLVAGKESTAALSLNAGGQLSVTGVTTIKSTGSVNVSSGKLQGGSVVNDGFLSVTVGGQLAISALTNNNNVNLSGPSTVTGPFINNGFMNVSHTTLSGGTLTNNVQLTLDAATVSNPISNEVGGFLTARGTVSNIINNKGTLNVSGLLTVNGINNSGLVTVNAGSSIAQGSIPNTGTITLAGGGITSPITNNTGGIVQGGGGITAILINNTGGLVYANNSTYPLVISAISTNQPGARIRVADGSSLNIGTTVANSGLITLGGEDANFSIAGSATLSNGNSGIISGAGTISANLNNSGTVRADGGQLLITGPGSSNQTTGLLQVSDDASLLFAQGLGSNSGTINVSGGSLIIDTVSTFTNSGKISGWGTFTTTAWSNAGTMTFTGGFTTINGTVNNQGTRKIEVANNPALFTGNVTNFGIFKNTKTSITFGGTYTENGTFISDPADNFFSSVSIGENGAWVGGVGDRFFLSGDLLSESKNKSGWQTVEAELRFMGGVRHLLSVAGDDRGISFDGYSDNFAWGDLVIGAGDSLALADGDEVPGGGLYVHRLLLGGGVGQISQIAGNGLSIYYDLSESANAYLGGASYALAGGGTISPVPEPGTMLWALLGAPALLRRRRICQ